MTNCPVQSMTNGGALWFEDLTISDPFCLLPVLTGASLFYQVSYTDTALWEDLPLN